jgi:hypothetical protein
LAEASSKKLEIKDWLPRTFRKSDRLNYWKAFYDLANRDYWKRVWVIQEIFFASAVIVRCGFRCMLWLDFIFLFASIMSEPNLSLRALHSTGDPNEPFSNTELFPSIANNCQIPAFIERWKKNLEKGILPSLEDLLFSYRDSLSTDPRDKVFAI